MKTLICGARGQLGSALQDVLPKDSFLALSHQELDITDKEAVSQSVSRYAPDVVINAAAYNQVDLAEQERDKAFAVNEAGPRNLAVAASKAGAIFVHVSTDYVFDGEKKTPYSEEDKPNPLSVYAESKLAGERAAMENCKRSYVVRTAWVYREGGHYFFRKMYDLSRQRKLKVVDDQYGSPTYAPHLARAILEMIQADKFGIYHLAGSGESTRYEMLRQLFEQKKLEINFEPVSKTEFNEAARRPSYSVLTTSRDPAILLPPWEEGLREFSKNFEL